MIWTSEYLERLALEAEIAIAEEIPCIIDWYSLDVNKNLDTYQLPDYIRDVRAVYWKGVRLDTATQSELLNWPIAYSELQGDGTYKLIKGSSAKPTKYWYNSFGENVIKFFPIPNESVGSGIFDFDAFEETVFNTADALSTISIEFYRVPDGEKFQIPIYIRKRTIKAYVLMKAFACEGDGQNLKASKYWAARYIELLARARKIIDNVRQAEIRSRSDTYVSGNARPARPRLPWNWQTITVDDYD